MMKASEEEGKTVKREAREENDNPVPQFYGPSRPST